MELCVEAMTSSSLAKKFLAKGIITCAVACVCAVSANAQLSCGDRPCPRVIVNLTKPSRLRPIPSPRPTNRGTRPQAESEESPKLAAPCKNADLVVVCGMPGCLITLNNTDKHLTDNAGGFIFQLDGKQTVKVKVTKPGYKDLEATKKLDCGGSQDVPAFLTANQVMLRIRTIPAECDIYLDSQKQPKGSDAQGLFSYLLTKPNLLIEAKKPKHLSKSRSIQLRPELANSEIVLELEALPATLRASTNVPEAQIAIDGKSSQALTGTLSLPPGHHSLVIAALGYTPATLDLSVGPDETISREVKLERLSISDLQAQAERLLSSRLYDDVLKLCGYIFESDRGNGVAHRLAGSVYLTRVDYMNASAQFDQALIAGEPIVLRIRRHPNEKFDLAKGHETCEAQITLRKNDVEFHSLRNAADDFKIGYDQLQVGAIQLKNSVAIYLATKVTINDKRRDYNFYAFDKELSQTGKSYLEMIQRLLRSH